LRPQTGLRPVLVPDISSFSTLVGAVAREVSAHD
jgi:hypothetical protein